MIKLAAGIIGTIASAISYISALTGEGWSRYFILVAGLMIDNIIGAVSGLYFFESLISFVVINAFGVSGFVFPVYHGVSSLLIIVVIIPVIFYLISTTR